jgi:hypothetical protein
MKVRVAEQIMLRNLLNLLKVDILLKVLLLPCRILHRIIKQSEILASHNWSAAILTVS